MKFWFHLFQFGKDMNNYLQSEMEALEREQSAIDQQAAILEKELREVMESGQSEAVNISLFIKKTFGPKYCDGLDM